MARRATIINEERGVAAHTLLLDAGNALLNDLDPAVATNGQTSIEAMNRLGYDAMTLGMYDIAPLPLDILRQRIAEAQFPVLSANALERTTRKLIAQPYVILTLDDHRVGILGLTDVGQSADVVVENPVEAAGKWLPEIRRQADIVIVLSHAGPAIDKQLAERLPEIDVIVSGHNTVDEEPLIVASSGTLIAHAAASHAGGAGQQLGLGRLSFDADGRVTGREWQRLDLSEEIASDAGMQAWVDSIVPPSR